VPHDFSLTVEKDSQMKKPPNPAFEAIHFVSILLSKFNSICERVTLVVEPQTGPGALGSSLRFSGLRALPDLARGSRAVC
jgi:hypothetical protein